MVEGHLRPEDVEFGLEREHRSEHCALLVFRVGAKVHREGLGRVETLTEKVVDVEFGVVVDFRRDGKVAAEHESRILFANGGVNESSDVLECGWFEAVDGHEASDLEVDCRGIAVVPQGY